MTSDNPRFNPNSATELASEEPNFATSVTAEHHALLKALQNFVIPLVFGGIDQKGKDDMYLPMGPEAGNFLVALQEFVSSIITLTQSDTRLKTIEVNLTEDPLPEDYIVKDNDEAAGQDSQQQSVPDSPGDLIAQPNSNSEDQGRVFRPLRSTTREYLLRELREVVFNKMPIRLLCFERYDTGLRISLAERGGIYARLAPLALSEFEEQNLETEGQAFQLLGKYTQYAILSHTWLPASSGEVTYSDWFKGSFDTKGPGYQKLLNFCKIAWNVHEVAYGWVDTVCINKESSSELDESIRSMYNWYLRAKVCIVYLANTDMLSDMDLDQWFTRGWTLQELLAPGVIKFYNSNWKQLVIGSENDKENNEITEKIEQATTITRRELYNIQYGSSISRKMQLAATRKVTREEDTAYSLMGIFDVSFSTAYGEGAARAFSRLLQAILSSALAQSALDILNWAGSTVSLLTTRSGMLPPSPESYLHRLSGSYMPATFRPIEPLMLTHLGLRIPLLLIPGISVHSNSASEYEFTGDYGAITSMTPLRNYIPTTYNLLDKRIYQQARADGRTNNGHHQYTFGVFNVFARSGKVLIPSTVCRAKCLKCFEAAGSVTSTGEIRSIATATPISFRLMKYSSNKENTTNDPQVDSDDSVVWEDGMYFYRLDKDELADHGMQLVTLYL